MKLRKIMASLVAASVACTAMAVSASAVDFKAESPAKMVLSEYGPYYQANVEIDVAAPEDIAGKTVTFEITVTGMGEYNGVELAAEDIELSAFTNSEVSSWFAGDPVVAVSGAPVTVSVAVPENFGGSWWQCGFQINASHPEGKSEEPEFVNAGLNDVADDWYNNVEYTVTCTIGDAAAPAEDATDAPATAAVIPFLAIPAILGVAGMMASKKSK